MKKIIVFSIALLLTQYTHANYSCSGKVVHLGSDTRLAVSTGFGVHKICKLSEDRCKFWASILTAAKLSERTVSIFYSHPSISGNQNQSACKEIGDWVLPSDTPYYVELH